MWEVEHAALGGEYTFGTFAQICELGASVVNLPAYRPELKGPVKKFFDVVQNYYKPHLKGKGVIESDFQERGGHDYQRDACLTLADFETIILIFQIITKKSRDWITYIK